MKKLHSFDNKKIQHLLTFYYSKNQDNISSVDYTLFSILGSLYKESFSLIISENEIINVSIENLDDPKFLFLTTSIRRLAKDSDFFKSVINFLNNFHSLNTERYKLFLNKQHHSLNLNSHEAFALNFQL